MFDIVTITTNLGETATFDPDALNEKHRNPQYQVEVEEQLINQNTTKPQRWIGIDLAFDFSIRTKWIEISVDLQSPIDEKDVRGWYLLADNLEGFSLYENSENTLTTVSNSRREIFESGAKLRLYVNNTFETTFDYSPPVDGEPEDAQYGIDHTRRFYTFRLATVTAKGTANLKAEVWTEEYITREENPDSPRYPYNTGDLYFRIGLNATTDEDDADFQESLLFELDSEGPLADTRLIVDSAYINGFRMDSGHIRHLAYVNLLEGDSASHLTFATGDFKGLSVDSIDTHIKLTNEKTIGTGDTKLIGNLIDFDYDSHPNTDSSIAIASNQSIYNFLDRNNNDSGNYWALYNNIDPYDPPQGIDSAVFYIDEDGFVKTKGAVETPSGFKTINYTLDSDGLRWRDSNLPRIFFDSAEQAWKIIPDIFGFVRDSELNASEDNAFGLMPRIRGRLGEFLSYDSPEFYDYSLKFGRFIEDDLEREKKYIPDTLFYFLTTERKRKFIDNFDDFSHGKAGSFTLNLEEGNETDDDNPINDQSLLYPFRDSDIGILSFETNSSTIVSSHSAASFAGLLSNKAYENYIVEASINAQDSFSDLAGFLVVAAVRENGREHTLSLFRRPKASIKTYDEYENDLTNTLSPPGWGLVYNFGQYDVRYLFFDDATQQLAPPPVLPNFEHQSTSSWYDAGISRIYAEKQDNIITGKTSHFGSAVVQEQTLISIDIKELSIEAGYEFLKLFVDTETHFGFGTNGLDIIFSDIAFTADPKYNNIYDLKRDLVYNYIIESDNSISYSVLDSSVPVSRDHSTGRLFWNPLSKTLYWKDPDNFTKLLKDAVVGKIELRGADSTSEPYMYINEDLNYLGHDQGLKLTIFNNIGDQLSSATFNLYSDSLASSLLDSAITHMSEGNIGTITSYHQWNKNISDDLRNTAFDQGLMKLYSTQELDSYYNISNSYAAVFQKTLNNSKRAQETSGSGTNPFADLNFSISNGSVHTWGPFQPSFLSGIDGTNQAYIDQNENIQINNTLMLREGRYKGMAFEGTSFTSTGVNDDSARIYLTSEEDSQRTMVLKVGDNPNDKIAFEVPDLNGVLQNGFVNLHQGNLEIVYDQTPQLGGDLDVQSFRILRDSLAFELFDLGYSLGKGTNSVALAARQSLHFFLDRNDNETDNIFGIFADKNPLIDAVTPSNAIFYIKEDGSSYFTGPADFTAVPAGNTPTTQGEGSGRFPGLTTDDVPHGPSGKNLYFDSARIHVDLQVGNNNINSNYDASEGGIGSISIDRSTNPDTITFSGITNTDGLPEGTTNLYFTDERAQDAVGSIMSGDNNISVVYDDGANTIAITSSLTQETVFGLQTKYSLTSVGGNTNAVIRLVIESDGITRNEDVGVTGTNGIVVDGGTNGSIVISAGELEKASTFFSDDVTGGVKLVFRESDIVNFTVDDPVSLLGADGISLTQQNGNEVTISGADLQAVGSIYADSNGGNVFIRLNDSSPVNGSTLSSTKISGSNGIEINSINNTLSNSEINISAAALQITSTLQANTTSAGVDTRITFTETDAASNSTSQFVEFIGTGGITVSSIGPAGVHDGIITISADSMHHPNTTYIANFATPLLSPSNEVDFNLLHEGPDSGQDTTLKIVTENGITTRESDGGLVIGSVAEIVAINNETISFEAVGNAIDLGTTTSFTTNSSTSETIQIEHGTTGSGAPITGGNTGSTFIQNVSVDSYGHITSLGTGTAGEDYYLRTINSGAYANNVGILRLATNQLATTGIQEVRVIGEDGVQVSTVQSTSSTTFDTIKIRLGTSSNSGLAFNDLTDGDATGTTNSNVGFDIHNGSTYHVGHVPVWDGSNFTTRKINFNGDDITSLDVSGVGINQVLAYVGPNFPAIGGTSRWKNADLADLLDAEGIDIPSSIDDLSDVDTSTTAPTSGQVLVWNGSKFVPGTVATTADIPTSIDDLSDVDTSTNSPTSGQALVWNGSNFVPGTVATNANYFSTISVSGQSNVVAEQADDTLTLVAGSGVSITTTASTDRITISSNHTAGNGLYLNPLSDEFSVDLKSNMGLIFDNTELSIDTTIHTNDIQAQTSGSSVTLSNSAGSTKLEITNSGGLNLNGTSAGTFTVSSAGAVVAADDISAFSDERLKTDVKTIDNALDLVNKLRGVSFTKNQKSGIGVIAQEMEKVIPEVVNTAEDEMGTKSVAYGNLVGVLIEAIKELSEKVEKLERER